MPEHPRSFLGGWIYEHRLVAERSKQRLLSPEETVHHINEQKDFNQEENLFVCFVDEHDRAHGKIIVVE